VILVLGELGLLRLVLPEAAVAEVRRNVRGRGTLTLPASLREKYRLGEGDPLTVVDLDGAVLLSPKVLVVPRLAAEMERLRRTRKLSLKDLGGPARED
jgi:bifunctional DNA-binding transcriptional regulator/antitoxin component of YhaV-PrlF toxin-antitoxin module